MSTQQTFILPLKGLGKGLYEYDMTVDKVAVHLIVDKRSREMVIDFQLSGTVATDCDRCLAAIDLPVSDRRQLIVKFTEDAEEQLDEGDIVYVHTDTNEFDLAPFAREMVALSVPMIHTFDCREGEPPYPCDEEMLDRIDASYEVAADVPAKEAEDDRPSPWDVLKKLNKN